MENPRKDKEMYILWLKPNVSKEIETMLKGELRTMDLALIGGYISDAFEEGNLKKS